MSAICPNCDVELNEQMECAECGYSGADSIPGLDDEPAEDIAHFKDDPLDPVDLADIEAEDTEVDHEPDEFNREDELLHEDEEASFLDLDSAAEDSPDETNEDVDASLRAAPPLSA